MIEIPMSLPAGRKSLMRRKNTPSQSPITKDTSSVVTGSIPSKATSPVNYAECLNILDERKEEFHGHGDCVRMHKGVPVLWVIQSAVQCKGSSLPYVHKVLPLDFPSGTKHAYSSKKALLKWATEGMFRDGRSELVFDSFYSSREAIEWIHPHHFFFTSLNKLWWDPEWRALVSYMIDEGDVASMEGEGATKTQAHDQITRHLKPLLKLQQQVLQLL